MQDAQLRREYHRLCKKKPGTLVDTEACFRAFKAGCEYMAGIESPQGVFAQVVNAYEAQVEMEG